MAAAYAADSSVCDLLQLQRVLIRLVLMGESSSL
jgi:hypothetical protein